MRRRVEIDDTQPAVAIPAPVLHELYQHAREVLPEECCGLILRDGIERFGRVVRCNNEMTKRHLEDPKNFPRDGRQAFYMSPDDYMKFVTSEPARVSAVYHSHVGVGAYLSEMDLEYAEHSLFPFPAADQIVVAVVDGRVGASAIFQRGEAGGYAGRPIVSAGP